MSDNKDNRRLSSRRRLLKGGIIAFNQRYSTLPCVVRDLSETGARLQIQSSVATPDAFTLIIELDGFEADCKVVRRTAEEVAVAFVAAPRKGTPRRSQIVKPLVPEPPPTLRRKPRQ